MQSFPQSVCCDVQRPCACLSSGQNQVYDVCDISEAKRTGVNTIPAMQQTMLEIRMLLSSIPDDAGIFGVQIGTGAIEHRAVIGCRTGEFVDSLIVELHVRDR